LKRTEEEIFQKVVVPTIEYLLKEMCQEEKFMAEMIQ